MEIRIAGREEIRVTAYLWALALREIAAIAGFQADGHDLTYILNGGVILARMLKDCRGGETS